MVSVQKTAGVSCWTVPCILTFSLQCSSAPDFIWTVCLCFSWVNSNQTLQPYCVLYLLFSFLNVAFVVFLGIVWIKLLHISGTVYQKKEAIIAKICLHIHVACSTAASIHAFFICMDKWYWNFHQCSMRQHENC